MRVGSAALALAVLLAGCGKGEDSGNNSSGAATSAVEQVDDNLMEDPQNRVVPIAPPTPQPLRTTALPDAFQGRWGLTANDCDPSRDDAKGLMVVEPQRLVFYEARATVARIAATGEGRLDVRLSFSGEGQEWTADQRLTLLDGGRTLVREESAPPTSLRYQRCPA